MNASGVRLLDKYNPLDIDQVRQKLIDDNEQAVGHLCWAGLDHASDAITHTDEKILQAVGYLKQLDKESWIKLRQSVKAFASDVGGWMKKNPLQCVFMVIGLGASVYKSKTIGFYMERSSSRFIKWGLSVSTPVRFLGFCVLMTVRLIVSTLIPPTSPAFGLILSAATPESEKWTSMPLFLAASTVAGAAPYIMDKILQRLTGQDFKYTEFMRWFASAWPLTCWTAPTMHMVFHSTGGGKLGASMAVIVAHAAPFMGAQTTNMQCHFLPHPLDTIISQPFGMSEDLLSIALAEATTNPALGSISLTLLVTGFNLARYTVFTRMDEKKAGVSAVVNFVIGVVVVYMIYSEQQAGFSGGRLLALVLFQFVIQIFVTPLLLRCATVHRQDESSSERTYDHLSPQVVQMQRTHQQHLDELQNKFDAERTELHQQLKVREVENRTLKEPQKKVDVEKSEIQQKLREKEVENHNLKRKVDVDTSDFQRKLVEKEMEYQSLKKKVDVNTSGLQLKLKEKEVENQSLKKRVDVDTSEFQRKLAEKDVEYQSLKDQKMVEKGVENQTLRELQETLKVEKQKTEEKEVENRSLKGQLRNQKVENELLARLAKKVSEPLRQAGPQFLRVALATHAEQTDVQHETRSESSAVQTGVPYEVRTLLRTRSEECTAQTGIIPQAMTPLFFKARTSPPSQSSTPTPTYSAPPTARPMAHPRTESPRTYQPTQPGHLSGSHQHVAHLLLSSAGQRKDVVSRKQLRI